MEIPKKVVERLVFASQDRDNTMGDQCRLLEVKAEMREAAKEARNLLKQACEAVIPDLEHYASTHGPGPDKRLAELKVALNNIKEE